MKIGEFDITNWTYRGEEMVSALQIARRAFSFPVIWVGKGIIFLGVAFGWGRDEALYVWRDLP